MFRFPSIRSANVAGDATRPAAARALARHPRLRVSDVEARLGTRYSAETIAALRARFPSLRFVWIMGAVCAPSVVAAIKSNRKQRHARHHHAGQGFARGRALDPSHHCAAPSFGAMMWRRELRRPCIIGTTPLIHSRKDRCR